MLGFIKSLRRIRPVLPSLPLLRWAFASTDQFLISADRYLQGIRDQLDKYSEELVEDVTYAAGVLTITFTDKTKYIINRQTPTQQIWLVSPLSGPSRYNYDENKKQWVENGKTMTDKLNEEFEKIKNSVAPKVNINKLI